MKSSVGKQWRAVAFEWQELGAMRQAALERVWLLVETIEDQALAQDIRNAIVGEFIGIPSSDDGACDDD
ncbi:hypothetical protein SEA_SHAGRAT_106 [Rhodococcus phage Shagrat]|nr:hypothetical protein SEA_SHAGRAT_106 [Rhodococcus phage Shagrat]